MQHLTCSHCGKAVTCSENHVGTSGKCPGCGCVLQIPFGQTSQGITSQQASKPIDNTPPPTPCRYAQDDLGPRSAANSSPFSLSLDSLMLGVTVLCVFLAAAFGIDSAQMYKTYSADFVDANVIALRCLLLFFVAVPLLLCIPIPMKVRWSLWVFTYLGVFVALKHYQSYLGIRTLVAAAFAAISGLIILSWKEKGARHNAAALSRKRFGDFWWIVGFGISVAVVAGISLVVYAVDIWILVAAAFAAIIGLIILSWKEKGARHNAAALSRKRFGIFWWIVGFGTSVAVVAGISLVVYAVADQFRGDPIGYGFAFSPVFRYDVQVQQGMGFVFAGLSLVGFLLNRKMPERRFAAGLSMGVFLFSAVVGVFWFLWS